MPPAGRGCRARTYAILEARDAIGGTWDLFRYPGIRSDSDMHTFGYAFKPWTGDKAIADGDDDPRVHPRDRRARHGIDRHIRFGHRVVARAWSSATALLDGRASEHGERADRPARWFFCAARLLPLRRGLRAATSRARRFAGQIVHPQHWPEDLDYAGKRVVVIGSGATAVTLVPAMAETAAHVTMLQRSPTYILSLPAHDPLADVAAPGCSARARATG